MLPVVSKKSLVKEPLPSRRRFFASLRQSDDLWRRPVSMGDVCVFESWIVDRLTNRISDLDRAHKKRYRQRIFLQRVSYIHLLLNKTYASGDTAL